MKLKQATFNSQTLGVEKEMSFEIESESPVIFDILRDKMYSNKIAAVCREVISNSRDANRENGKENTPTKITIAKPNKYFGISDMSIVFEDFGKGINPSRMESIFLKYGASTKRDTNDQTGGFGLGAKTPFAYNDTFTVITVCDTENGRIKYTYNAMIDSSRKGKMVLFDSDYTVEETGTKIIVPIDKSDVYEFQRQCYRATMFWDVRPEYIGFDLEEPQIDVFDKEEGLIFTDLSKSGEIINEFNYILLIDGIPYPITDMGSLNKNYPESLGTVLVPFKTGQLTISANRESVQFDKETVELIEQRLDKLNEIFPKKVKSIFDDINQKNLLEKIRLYNQYQTYRNSSWRSDIDSDIKLIVNIEKSFDEIRKQNLSSWKEIHDQYPALNWNKKHLRYFEIVQANTRFYDSKTEYTTVQLPNVEKDSIFFLKDEKKLNRRRNESAQEIADAENKEEWYILKPLIVLDSEGRSDELSFIVNELELDVRMYDDLKYSKKKSGGVKTYNKPEKVGISYREISNTSRNYLIYNNTEEDFEQDIDRKNTCVYVVKTLGEWDRDNKYMSPNQSLVDKGAFLLENFDCKIIVISERSYRNYFEETFLTLEEWEEKYSKKIQKRVNKLISIAEGLALKNSVLPDKFENKYIKTLLPSNILDKLKDVKNIENGNTLLRSISYYREDFSYRDTTEQAQKLYQDWLDSKPASFQYLIEKLSCYCFDDYKYNSPDNLYYKKEHLWMDEEIKANKNSKL